MSKLDWPIDESMEGKKVVFLGFTNDRQSHWSYEIGKTYIIKCYSGWGDPVFGPEDTDSCIPDLDFGFDFELVD